MRRWIAGLVLIAALSISASAQTSERSSAQAADDLVDWVVGSPPGLTLGFWIQCGRMLGDPVAVAVARKFRLVDLLNSDTANRVLVLLRCAFEDPSYIKVEQDKKPGVTLLLLDHLANHSPDSSIRQRAVELIDKITAAPARN